ncbi:hypothetical protein TIFTF001_029297 [Ficus carica]|uniref:Uncharacterized protein n=1 Tax=Ficus carica TaxID=3494 RepID=A0AA88J375_FICCA|nr:hypothetical protein TIFTF001_029297 [Ficus carica]
MPIQPAKSLVAVGTSREIATPVAGEIATRSAASTAVDLDVVISAAFAISLAWPVADRDGDSTGRRGRGERERNIGEIRGEREGSLSEGGHPPFIEEGPITDVEWFSPVVLWGHLS